MSLSILRFDCELERKGRRRSQAPKILGICARSERTSRPRIRHGKVRRVSNQGGERTPAYTTRTPPDGNIVAIMKPFYQCNMIAIHHIFT